MDLSRNKLGGKYKRSRECHREEAIQEGREGGREEQGSQGEEPSLQLPQTPDPFDSFWNKKVQPRGGGREEVQPRGGVREEVQPRGGGREEVQPQGGGREKVRPRGGGRKEVQPRGGGRDEAQQGGSQAERGTVMQEGAPSFQLPVESGSPSNRVSAWVEFLPNRFPSSTITHKPSELTKVLKKQSLTRAQLAKSSQKAIPLPKRSDKLIELSKQKTIETTSNKDVECQMCGKYFKNNC